jgi:hypothetical protein
MAAPMMTIRHESSIHRSLWWRRGIAIGATGVGLTTTFGTVLGNSDGGSTGAGIDFFVVAEGFCRGLISFMKAAPNNPARFVPRLIYQYHLWYTIYLGL